MAKFFNINEFRTIVHNVLADEDITVTEAATAMNLSSRTLYNFLDGKTPSVDSLDLMASYLKGGAGVYLP